MTAIVAIGEPMIEFNQTLQGEPRYLQGFGGDTSNFSIAAARQGARAGYITRLGDDAFGRMFLNLWQREEIDVSGVAIDPDAHTAAYFVTHDAGGHQFSFLRSGSAASKMTTQDLPLSMIRGARFLHVSGISQAISGTACDAVFSAMRAAREAGVAVCYDSNLRLKLWPIARARAIICESIRWSDYFFPSLEDAEMLSERHEPHAILDWCFAHGARAVLLKLGEEGVLVAPSRHAERVHLRGHAVAAVDATGAGDCFAGALVARLAAGDDILAAARYANAAAAITTMDFGAVAPIPFPHQVQALLAEQGTQ
ncbi:MAG: sugar kinase [Betaproteobacteria bacterium]